MDELELIELAKAGNKSALNTLLQQNYKMLYGFAIKMTANETLAQDIVQEALLKAVLNIKKFKGSCKFSTWLIQISINVYKDYKKKNKFIDPEQNIIPAESENVEEKALMLLQYEEALDELRKMPHKKRTAFILKHYYGYSLEEIAGIMDCPTGTVKSRISNCIDSLKRVLES